MKHRWTIEWVTMLVMSMCAGCGEGAGSGSEGDGDADSDADTDADADSDSDSDADADGDSDADGDADADADADADGDADGDCAQELEELAQQLYPGGQACTAVVRIRFGAGLEGYHILCGDAADLSEGEARAVADEDSGYGTAGTLLSGPAPEDEWVFWQSALDFGGVSVVSAETGLSVFGGSIVWNGRGDLLYPGTWEGAPGLGADCHQAGIELGPVRGFELENGTAMVDGEAESIAEALQDTALPTAMDRTGTVVSTMVLMYPRSVGWFDPDVAEWIVMLNGIPD